MKRIKKKNIYMIITVVVIIIITIIVLSALSNAPKNNKQASPPSANTQQQTPVTQPIKTSQQLIQQALSYQDALKIYQGKRFQFSSTKTGACFVTPNISTFKNNTKIMLDNREAKQITVYLNGVAHVMSALSFKIITLSATKPLPQEVKIDCQNNYSIGKLTIQQ